MGSTGNGSSASPDSTSAAYAEHVNSLPSTSAAGHIHPPAPSAAATGTGSGTTTAAAAAAAAARPPRKLNRSANQLHRNQACLPCRRRRIKCDAARPHCSSCTRSFRFLARTQPDPERDAKGVQCAYEDAVEGEREDDESVIPEEETVEEPRDAVRRLEARIAELQTALAQMSTKSAPAPAAAPAEPPAHHHAHVTPSAPVYTDSQSTWMGMNWMQHSSAPAHPLAQSHTAAHVVLETTPPLVVPPVLEQTVPPVPEQQPGPAPPQPASERVYGNPIELQRGLPTSMPGMDIDLSVHAVPLPPPAGAPPSGFAQAYASDTEAGTVGGPLLDILWPGWPPRLPTPTMLDHLVQTFFNVVPSISRILHRQSFLSRLSLPPTHSNFPHPALLHAICAVTARYSAAVKVCTVEESLKSVNDVVRGVHAQHQFTHMTGDEEAAQQTCFGDRHSIYASQAIRVGTVTGRKMLELCQAQAILAVYYQQHAKWMQGWQITGAAARLAVALGLMADTKGNERTRNSIIEGPTEDWDREERRLLMSYILTLDFMGSTTSGWSSAVALDELMCRLPTAREDFDRGGSMPENPQTWYSLDLYSYHSVVDNWVLFCKGVHLLGQVIKFKRKCQALDDPFAARYTALFRKLDADISDFHYSFPPELRDPLRPGGGFHRAVDADLIGAHIIPHIAAIKLHESFADLTRPDDSSAVRILGEARAVLSIVYLLTSTTMDFSKILNPVTSFYFFAAARTFVLFYQQCLMVQDYAQAKLLLSEIDVFRMAFKTLAQRFALAARHEGMINQMLQACYDDLGVTPEDLRTDELNISQLPGRDDWRRMPHAWAERTANWNLGGTRKPHVDFESSLRQWEKNDKRDVHHPLHNLFLSRNTSFKEKMDSSRGFHTPSPPSSGGGGGPPRPKTPPVTMTDGGAEWLNHLAPVADIGPISSGSSDSAFHAPSMHPHVGVHSQMS